MGVVIPQVVTTDRATGAQVVDGSLKFDGTSNYLTRSFGSGNRRTWTWAAWVKRYKFWFECCQCLVDSSSLQFH